MVNRSIAVAALVAGGLAAGACGGVRVRDVGSPLGDHIRQIRELSSRPVSRTAAGGGAVEAADPALSDALMAEILEPTAATHLRVAREYARLGILDAAYAAYNRALAREPRMAAAHEGVARVWRDWGFPDLGLGSAYRAVAYDPRSASARNTLGTILDRLGWREEARAAYLAASALAPAAPYPLHNLCSVEARLGRVDAARIYCEAAVVAERTQQAAALAARGSEHP